jgi:hypothetical protein
MKEKCNCLLCDTYVNKHNENDIDLILEYEVENPEYLEIINGTRGLADVISWSSLLAFMNEQNKKYCDEHCLCLKCREPLVEYNKTKYEDIYWECSNHCEY